MRILSLCKLLVDVALLNLFMKSGSERFCYEVKSNASLMTLQPKLMGLLKTRIFKSSFQMYFWHRFQCNVYSLRILHFMTMPHVVTRGLQFSCSCRFGKFMTFNLFDLTQFACAY